MNVSAGDFTQAQRLRHVFRRRMADVFSAVDVLITPSGLGEAARAEDMNLEMFLTAPMFTPQWNFSGLPALAAPIGFGQPGSFSDQMYQSWCLPPSSASWNHGWSTEVWFGSKSMTTFMFFSCAAARSALKEARSP